MAFVNRREKGLVIALSGKESKESGLVEGKRYDLKKTGEGEWLLAESKAEDSKEQELEQKILKMLDKESLGERVEGKFEEKLSKEEQAVFKKMLDKGEVVAFKLNDKYKKAVYKVLEEKETQGGVAGPGKAGGVTKPNKAWSAATEKPSEEYTIEEDGIMVIKNTAQAQVIALGMQEKIKEGEIKGIKGFDGPFYVITSELYEKFRETVLKVFKSSQKIGLVELAEKAGASKTLCKIVCEFLKEEGEIIEKRKESYEFISEE